MKKYSTIISIVFVMSVFIFSGCGIGLQSMEEDNRKTTPGRFVGQDMEGGVDGKVEKRKPLPPTEKHSMALENTVLTFLTPKIELVSEKNDAHEDEKYLLKSNSCYGENKNICLLVWGSCYDVKEIERTIGGSFYPNLENVLKNSLEGMKSELINNREIKKLRIQSIKDRMLWKKEGKELTGSCELDVWGETKIYYIDYLAFFQDGDLWCVLVLYDAFDKEAERTKNLIINSIEIK